MTTPMTPQHDIDDETYNQLAAYGFDEHENWKELKQIITAYCQKQLENAVVYSPRYSGKTLRQFKQFMDAIETGKTVEWHGKDYVVMSRNQYQKLQDRIAELSNQQPSIEENNRESD